MKLVIVESPAKAKTINKYLGAGYKVIASYGHVRDLPSKDGSVDPDHKFAMIWEISDRSKKQIDAIVKEAKTANEILLATDPDREGEAISWHIKDIIHSKGIKDKPIQRIAFHEITKSAINKAINSPRDLDQSLIEAYLARRALDYLVGFNISPVLWRKLPGSKSAGRVQSVALRLIADRELEIEEFKPQEFWTVEALFKNEKGDIFPAKLTVLNGEKLEKFSLNNAQLASAAIASVDGGKYRVENVEKKSIKRNPWPPFITSTLQQEASRKLGFSSKRTMQLAQSLYEGASIDGETIGLITYMRTDSVNLASDAVSGIREAINQDFGEKYLPKSPRVFQNKVKNAQEAHEAIRPTNVLISPSQLQGKLDKDLWRLYDLIWKRTVACQMQQALIDQVIVDICDSLGKHVFRAVGSTVAFDGFLKLYQEEKDDDKGDDGEGAVLPPLSAEESVIIENLDKKQHFTQSPPRYTEASLVKRLEELGIGRPSTYANIIQVLQDRNYVRLDKKRFFPEERGMIVNTFLLNYFAKYVEYDFTADLEQQLDDISNARISRLKVLDDFWQGFTKVVDVSKELRITEVLNLIEDKLNHHLFPVKDGEDRNKTRACPMCGSGRVGLKLGRYGAFLGCSSYPKCSFTSALYDNTASSAEADGRASVPGKYEPKVLGKDPNSGQNITLRKGPYGFYVQVGEAAIGNKGSVKRVSVPKAMDPEQISLPQARILISLPKILGKHPDDGKEVSIGVGRFGPYVRHDNKFFSLDYAKLFSLSSVDQAIALITEAAKNSKSKKTT